MGHYVYKYVYDGEIIYIGKNDTDIHKRIKQHGKPGDNIDAKFWGEINSSEVFYCELANRTMSDVVESELIRRYKPKCNIAKTSDWSGLCFEEPKWIKYEKKQSIKKPKKKNRTTNDPVHEKIKTYFEQQVYCYFPWLCLDVAHITCADCILVKDETDLSNIGYELLWQESDGNEMCFTKPDSKEKDRIFIKHISELSKCEMDFFDDMYKKAISSIRTYVRCCGTKYIKDLICDVRFLKNGDFVDTGKFKNAFYTNGEFEEILMLYGG